MTAEQAIEYIHSVCWKGSIPGLGRTQTLLSLMGDPHKQLKYVHIAGTNGKGSTAAMTASILRKAGYKVGLYTSPYIYRFNERMQIDGQQIPDQELADITEWVKPLAQSMAETPTEFELVSCIAFEYFKRNNCDIVVLEVGAGLHQRDPLSGGGGYHQYRSGSHRCAGQDCGRNRRDQSRYLQRGRQRGDLSQR